MTRSEQREFNRAMAIAPQMPELAARMLCTLFRAGKRPTQNTIETALACHPRIRDFVRGTAITGYYVQ